MNKNSQTGLSKLSVNDVLISETPGLISVFNSKGEQAALDILDFILSDFLKFIGQELSAPQRNQICFTLLNSYPNYRPEFFRLCFDRIKNGTYGTIYGQVNGMVIMEFFKKYDIALDEEIQAIRAKEANEHKANNNLIEEIYHPKTYDEKCKAEFAAIKKTLENIGKQNETKHKITPSIKIDAPIGIIQDWLKEFDELYKSTGIQSEMIKRAEYNGTRLSQLQFLEMKRKEFSDT